MTLARDEMTRRPGLVRSGVIMAVLAAAFCTGGCGRQLAEDDALMQRGYLWQRDWTAQVPGGAILLVPPTACMLPEMPFQP